MQDHPRKCGAVWLLLLNDVELKYYYRHDGAEFRLFLEFLVTVSLYMYRMAESSNGEAMYFISHILLIFL